ncbi:MAG: GAF domain-containing protein [Deltaproteobacteria bacterium]|nr:GAF domain-containing protein [Deltaproteobacteria bacterium]
MKNTDKTKEQLIDEIEELRQRIAELQISQEHREQEEKALRESEKLFRMVADFTYDWEYWLSPDGKYLYVSPACQRITGYSVNEFYKEPKLLNTITHPEDHDVVCRHLEESLKSDKALHVDFRIITRNGEERWISHFCQPIYGKDQSYLGRRASNRDISRRKELEEELRRANRSLRMLSACNHALIHAENEESLLDSVCQIIVEAGGFKLAWVGFKEKDQKKTVRLVAQAGYEEGYLESLHITWANRERGRGPTGRAIRSGEPSIARDILNDPSFAPWRAEALKRGFASSVALPLAIRGKTFGALNIYSSEADAFDPAEVNLLGELAGDLSFGIIALRTRIEQEVAEKALRKAHRELERRVKERTRELVEANERLKNEIEERRRLEKILTQKEKLETLGAIAAEVAHEIRNPLVSIGGFARRLGQKFPDLTECEIILRESERLERILSRIGDYLKPVEVRFQECSINSIVGDCKDLLSPELERRKIICRLDLDPELSPVRADPDILKQAFINLIRKGAELMADGGNIVIKTRETEKEILTEFGNQAAGLKVKRPEQLFMPFADEGESIGLPLSYRLLKDMGGLLSFSQTKDYIVFTVTLAKNFLFQHPEESN